MISNAYVINKTLVSFINFKRDQTETEILEE